jgi:BirA family transcriptional regulator, biotin operon repressor / biotin---[acetyl-CoA-carboxylase] ligase
MAKNQITNLKTKFIGKRIFDFDEIDSTSLEAFRLINEGKARHGDVIIAKIQTSGKGQFSRSWISREGGLYMSIILCSKADENLNLITFACALAVIDALKKITGMSAELKWVNDIILNRKKLGGILTQSVTRGDISTIVCGIGININSQVDDIEDENNNAVSIIDITSKETNMNFLITALCEYFEYYFDEFQKNPQKIIENWMQNSRILNKKVLLKRTIAILREQ